MVTATASTVFTEVFPIRAEAIPTLYAYQLVMGGGDNSTIGGKLSYRLRRVLGGHWVWTGNRLVSDAAQSIEKVMEIVQELWREQPDTFRDLRGVQNDSAWRSTPQAQADFVARGLYEDFRREVQQILDQRSQDLGNVMVERVCEPRGWVVNNRPALSISIFSHLIYREDLETYLAHLSDLQDLVGLNQSQNSLKPRSLTGLP
jgi:hypothetical protein